MEMIFLFILSSVLLGIVCLGAGLYKQLKARSQKTDSQTQGIHEQLAALTVRTDERNHAMLATHEQIVRLLNEHKQTYHEQRTQFDQHQLKSLALLQESLQKGVGEVRQQVLEILNSNATTLNQQVGTLTQTIDKRLHTISGQVEKRLSAGFEKTTTLFTDVVKRLALIDAAQKKITELSTSVVDLQNILADKRSRGAFGEVQLSNLVRNAIPPAHFALQHTLSNGKRADCILFLPDPSGNIIIDAKFPLESYQRLTDRQLVEAERKTIEQQFRVDIRKHIQDIASKYIIPGETADSALMFIPAEAVFAEIHAHYPELVSAAHKAKVWIVSPTTIMAILTTALAVLKDVATRQQVHIIQQHLVYLSQDFERFQKRMDNLARHIEQAHVDVEQVHKSSKKISQRFTQIERVELQQEAPALEVT